MDKYNGEAGRAKETVDEGSGEGEGWEESSGSRESRWPIGTSLPWCCVIILLVNVGTQRKSPGFVQIMQGLWPLYTTDN